MKRPFSLPYTPAPAPLSLLGLACFFLFFVLGCSLLNREGEAAPPAEGQSPAQQAQLVCSDECAARGQCGELTANNQPVILGHPDRPAVQDHQMTFPVDTPLPVLGVQDQTLQTIATGEQFNHTFYLVQRPDGRAGWIAGWCLNVQ